MCFMISFSKTFPAALAFTMSDNYASTVAYHQKTGWPKVDTAGLCFPQTNNWLWVVGS